MSEAENTIDAVDVAEDANAVEAAGPAGIADEPKRRNTKKCILTLVLIALVAGCAVLATRAYTVRTTTADNIITFGSVRIQVLETELVNGVEQEVPDGHSARVISSPYSRIVRVANVGNDDCYVRVKLQMTYEDAGGTSTDVTDQTTFSATGTEWTMGPDGYWYYGKVLTPSDKDSTTGVEDHDTSAPVVETVELPRDLVANGNKGDSFTLSVQVQAVQAEHQGEAAAEQGAIAATGWPE